MIGQPEQEDDLYSYEVTTYEVDGNPVEIRYDQEEHRVVVRSELLHTRRNALTDTLRDDLNLRFEEESYGRSRDRVEEVYLETSSGMTLVDDNEETVEQLLTPQQ